MLDGSTSLASAARRGSRDAPASTSLGSPPIVQAWAAAGHQSLAEITSRRYAPRCPPTVPVGSGRVRAQVPVHRPQGPQAALHQPHSRYRHHPGEPVCPPATGYGSIRAALSSPDPAIALAVALVAFHAVTSKELQELRLTDVVERQLTLHGRVIPLGDPVRVRLTAWLDHRARTWPGSINPHLFVSRRSAPRFVPVGRQFPWRNTRLRPQALREDRILQEIIATGGDVRRICDLFGLSINAALSSARRLATPSWLKVIPGVREPRRGRILFTTHDPRCSRRLTPEFPELPGVLRACAGRCHRSRSPACDIQWRTRYERLPTRHSATPLPSPEMARASSSLSWSSSRVAGTSPECWP